MSAKPLFKGAVSALIVAEVQSSSTSDALLFSGGREAKYSKAANYFQMFYERAACFSAVCNPNYKDM